MAWEDRTDEQKAQAEREAAEYAATDDDRTYAVIINGQLAYTVCGIRSARVVAAKGGTIREASE
jgi:hypothetical protein